MGARWRVTALYLIYRVVLDLSYIYVVSPFYRHVGLTTSIDYQRLIFSYVAIALMCLVMPVSDKRISYMVLHLHFAVTIIPMASFYALSGASTSFMLAAILCFCLQAILLRGLRRYAIPSISGAAAFRFPILIFLTVVTYGYVVATQQLNFALLDLLDPIGYYLRAQREIPTFMLYLVVWQTRAINPILTVVFWLKGAKFFALLMVAAQVVFYLFWANKEILLSLLVIGLCIVISERRLVFSKAFVAVVTILAGLSPVLHSLSISTIPLAMVNFRLLFLPAMIKFAHYEFFSVNPKLYYSEGLIGRIFGLQSPYPVAAGFLVLPGGAQANTGYIAYAFSNAGYLGMLIMSLVLVAVLIFFDSLPNIKALFPALAVPMLMLNDIDLLTMLLNGGMFVYVLYTMSATRHSDQH